MSKKATFLALALTSSAIATGVNCTNDRPSKKTLEESALLNSEINRLDEQITNLSAKFNHSISKTCETNATNCQEQIKQPPHCENHVQVPAYTFFEMYLTDHHYPTLSEDGTKCLNEIAENVLSCRKKQLACLNKQ